MQKIKIKTPFKKQMNKTKKKNKKDSSRSGYNEIQPNSIPGKKNL